MKFSLRLIFVPWLEPDETSVRMANEKAGLHPFHGTASNSLTKIPAAERTSHFVRAGRPQPRAINKRPSPIGT